MRLFLFIALLMPGIYLSYEVFYLQDVNDPIKYIYTITGATALMLLFFTTTLSLIKKRINLIKYRRMIGLYGFFYALLHMLNFVILDAELDLIFAFEETLDKPFIYLGMIGFLILLFMAITSTKSLFKRFYFYHQALYVALILGTIHFIMAQKSLSLIQWGYLLMMVTIAYFKLQQLKLKYIK
jgi:sulfoxide reductase heme-binding subunit YedZ